LLTFTLPAGRHRLAFFGRLSRKKTLVTGRYTVTISASASGLTSAPARLSFTIVA
jgi:hypothetical protein